ncbi:MAG: hypothetical protein ACLUJG_08090 [Lawsonibacter sp.]
MSRPSPPHSRRSQAPATAERRQAGCQGQSRPQSAAPQADKQRLGSSPALREASPAAGVQARPAIPRAGEEGGGHPQGRRRQPGEVRRAAGVALPTERQQDRGGKQKFQGRNAQRQRGRQQGPGNKRKQEEQETPAPSPAGDRQEGTAEGADPR